MLIFKFKLHFLLYFLLLCFNMDFHLMFQYAVGLNLHFDFSVVKFCIVILYCNSIQLSSKFLIVLNDFYFIFVGGCLDKYHLSKFNYNIFHFPITFDLDIYASIETLTNWYIHLKLTF